MRHLLSLLLCFALVLPAIAQNGTDTQIRYGTSNPASCFPHAIFGNTSGSSTVYYFCTATNTWTPVIPSGAYVPTPINRRWMYLTPNSSGGITTAQAIGDTWTIALSTGGANSSLAAYSSGLVWVKTWNFALSTGTGSGTFAYGHGALGSVGWPSNVLFETTIALSTITSTRVRVGLCPSNSLCYSSDTPNLNMATFRFSTAASDTNFMCETGDGSAEQIQSSGVAPVASATNNALAAVYQLQIVANDGVPNVVFYINGNLVCTNTSHLPSSDTQLAQWMAIDPTAGVGSAETLWFPYVYVEADSH